MTFLKRNDAAPAGFFAAEAAGLAWLREAETDAGARVVRVASVTDTAIELEELDAVRPSAAAATAFGAALARTHAAGAPALGSPPPDSAGAEFIGRRPMACEPTASWGAFYAEQRVRPFVETAVAAGNLGRRAAETVDEVCDVIASGDLDDGAPPSRLHGDLWNGNVLWTPAGVVLIDPAAHGGHAETDLAMLALFGVPFLAEILAGYESVAPLRAGWRGRVPLHQLFPLAVHAAGHGPHYGDALEAAALAVLDTLGR